MSDQAPISADKKKNKKGGSANVVCLKDPEFFEKRIQLFDEYYKLQQEELAKKETKSIKITLPDGKVIEGVSFKTSPYDVAKGISEGLAKVVIGAKLNGNNFWDLHRPLEEDVTLELIKFDSEDGKKIFWHSSAHILGQALEKYYGASLCIGPATQDGFYYDTSIPENKLVSENDYETIQALVNKIVAEKQPFQRLVLPKNVALEMFSYNKYKVEIISSKVPDGETLTVYRCGPLIDLCRGPHLPNTGLVKAFAVTKNSSSYWLGKAENDSLQRVYGISFPEAKQLKEWKHFQEEAAKRDHRIVGKAQDLFFFHQLSPGCAFFLPHGTRIYNKLMDFLRAEYKNRGFTEVISPNIFNVNLWNTSGHWQNYQENMFSFEVEKQLFALKPMNCPGHCLMFQHKVRSYRELPLRFADFGVLHRNELSGALTGLTRVRRFQQDDAHIFCAAEDIEKEIDGCLQFLKHVYGIFGFQFSLELSTRPEKYLGEIEVWNNAEAALAKVLDLKFPKGWKLNPGDGAFYGPKIDIHIEDALKRSFQCATIQLDFQLPIRFGLEYQTDSAEGSYKRPVIIHRAILGSVERFMAILIEHTGGKWPFWISPRQVIVVPVSNKYDEYAETVRQQIHNAGFYVDSELSDKQLAKKIRESQLAQYNFILVVGQKEQDSASAAVRTRDGSEKDIVTKPVAEIIEDLKKLSAEYK